MTLFIVLNLLLTGFFIFQTVHADRASIVTDSGTDPIIPNILLMAVNAGFFTLFLVWHNDVTPSLFTILMRICFVIEGCLLVNIAFCFTYYAWKYTNTIVSIEKIILYLLAVYIAFFKFKQISVSPETGLVIKSVYLFSPSVQKYFPWTWVTLFNFIYRFFIPAFLSVVMLCRTEAGGLKLDKFKSYVYVMGLVAMWLVVFFLSIVSKVCPAYSLLHNVIFVPVLVIIPLGSRLTAAPSGRGTISFVVKSVFMYILPALAMGVVFMGLYPLHKNYSFVFIAFAFIAAAGVLYLVQAINKLISKSKFGHSAEYAVAFEKDLASIDYNGEMDAIADDMFHIFKNNAEASSMAVYINGGNDTYEVAYSSNSKARKLEGKKKLFEELLNMKRNVVISEQIDSLNDFATIRDEIKKFFAETQSDALFILNEGRDVHGLIILGIKTSKDHYKEYDYNVFTKLYSYFFVFGYFMRNISNKEIIGTVNRELRMSSQIITSIQDNIDILQNPKMDAGCIMVPAHNIGGEFVDMIRLTDSRHMFVVGDLSGKGIAASMNMVILKAIIRAYLAETHDFKQLVVKVNRFIRDNLPKGTIFAGMFAIVNFDNDTMYYINCGIPAMLLYTQSYNNVIEIQGEGHILGFVKDLTPYVSIKQIKLNKNDIVLACTDGLIESHSLRGEKFGKDRIQRFMVANSTYPAVRMAQFEYDELMKFMSHEMEDDVSVLVMKYLESNVSEKIAAEAIKRDFENSMAELKAMQNDSEEVEAIDSYETLDFDSSADKA